MLKDSFSNSLFEFDLTYEDDQYDAIMAFQRIQMEELYNMPTKNPRPDNTPGRTYRHSMRVAQDVYDFSRYIGLSHDMASHLKWATELHDIGKIDIPIEILDKPGKLTDAEFEEMKRHTDYGAKRIKDSGIDHPIIDLAHDIALYHHERMDGKGYHNTPAGGIPPFVRLVKICDIFDALSARRPYRTDRDQMSAFDVMEAMLTDDGFLYHEVDQDLLVEYVHMKCHILDTGLSNSEVEKLLNMIGRSKAA